MGKRVIDRIKRGVAKGKLDQIMFWLLCLFALSASLSVAVSNVAMGLLVPLTLYRLWREPPAWRAIWRIAPGVYGWFGFFALASLFSAAASPELQKGMAMFGNDCFYRLLPAAVLLFWIKDKNQLEILAGLMVLSITLNNLWGIGQILRSPFTEGARFQGSISFMAQGAMLSALIPLLAVATVRYGRSYPGVFVLFLVSIVALLLNGARGAWLAAFGTTVAAMALAVRDRKRFVAGFAVSLLLLSGVFSQSAVLHARLATLTQPSFQSNSERLLMWRSAFHMFQDHPFLGVGMGHYEKAYQTEYILPEAKERTQWHAHNNIMQMLGERGALGAVAYCGMGLYFLTFALRGWRKTQGLPYLAFFTIVLAILLQGLTDYNLWSAVVAKAYWFSLAICLQWIALTRKERIA
ncbi:MAG: O-antigen ligase family protein [Schwartzia sp. (in: firmicutes)]